MRLLQKTLNDFLRPKRERDSQRSKLYRAENAYFTKAGLDKTELPEVKDIEVFVKKVLNRAPIQRRYKAAILWGPVKVKDGRGHSKTAEGGIWGINMPRFARSRWLVLHELAHTITIRHHGRYVAAHGREYAAVYLNLVHFGLGKEHADGLKRAFIEGKVRFRPKRKVSGVIKHRTLPPRVRSMNAVA